MGKKGGDSDDDEQLEDGEVSIKEFNYLVRMPMISMTMEKVNKLTSEVEEKRSEIDTLSRRTIKDLWISDLDAFLAILDEVEEIELKDMQSEANKYKKKRKGKTSSRNRKP